MTMLQKKEQAIEAIRAANPKWSDKHVRYAYEMMPSTAAVYFQEGTVEHAYHKALHAHNWTKWAVEMNLVPEDTPIPPAPSTAAPVARARRNAPPATSEELDMAMYVAGFPTAEEAHAHAKRFGGAPVALLNEADNLYYPATYSTKIEAEAALLVHKIEHGRTMELLHPITRVRSWALGQTIVTHRTDAIGAPKAPRAPSGPEQNGIPLPRAGTAGDAAWKLCDELLAKLGRTPTPVEAREAGATAGLNPGNVATEMSRWRKYWGHPK